MTQPGDYKAMKKHIAAIEAHPDTIRAGVISLLILATLYLYITGLSDFPRVWAFIVCFSMCFVLMMKSVVDLLVWAFGLVASYFGWGLGHAVRLLRPFCR
jgi:hypothetical protein